MGRPVAQSALPIMETRPAAPPTRMNRIDRRLIAAAPPSAPFARLHGHGYDIALPGIFTSMCCLEAPAPFRRLGALSDGDDS